LITLNLLPAGWKISDENFLKDNEVIDFLKLRGSFGTLGNLVGNDLYRSALSGEATYVFDGALTNGVANGPIANAACEVGNSRKT
jgi:hypothetical protein